MNSFTISDLHQFSGIKPHTIRMWEQRFNALKPNRSAGNTRYYDGEQLKRLLNIVSLLKGKHKVSELCMMSNDQLNALLNERLNDSTQNTNQNEYFISQLISSALEFNESKFDKVFSNSILRIGLAESYTQILYPVLLRLGQMWSKNRLAPTQEHFISLLIRTKLFAAIDALPPAKETKKTWLLFLPENEYHEIGLLMAHFLIRQAGHKVINLGSDVPLITLSTAIKEIKPDYSLFFLVRKNDVKDENNWIKVIGKMMNKNNLFMACEAHRLKGLENLDTLSILHSMEDLQLKLKKG